MQADSVKELSARQRELLMLRLRRSAVAQPAASASPEIRQADRSRPLPLSWAQQRLWFLDQLDAAAGAAYNMPAALRLSGPLDRVALRATLDRIVARHESLRTTFVLERGEPVQRFAPADVGFQLSERDLRGVDVAVQQEELVRITEEAFILPFDLATGPLIRGELLQLADGEHVLLINQHHIVSDGWSIGVLLREVGTLYEAFSQGRADPLPPLPVQYADYAAWQRGWLQGRALQGQIDYWKNHLAGAPALLDLPLDRPRPAKQSYAGASVFFSFSPALTQAVKKLCQRQGVTLFMTLLAGWGVLMSRLSGQREVVVGSPLANRQRGEVEGLIGCFVNTLALRLNVDPQSNVAELLAHVKTLTLNGYAHQDVPFEQVVEVIKPQRSLSHSLLFQTALTMNLTQGQGELNLQGLRLSSVERERTTAQFDTSLYIGEARGVLAGSVSYASDLFDRATIQCMVARYEVVLREMAADELRLVGRLNLLDDAERLKLAQWSQGNVANYPGDRLIHQLFEEQVHKQPDALAVEYEGQRLTYAELNRRSNQVAHRLLALGARPGDRVALCVERGLSMMVGLMGILKAGAGFVPLDPTHPPVRLAQVLADCAPVALLTEDAVQDDLPAQSLLPVLVLDADPSLVHQPQANPQLAGLDGQHLAYVLYTSGSTGQPKGVMVEHRSVLNLWQALERTVLAPADRPLPAARVALNAAISFDASLQSITQLLGGRCVVIVPREVRSDGAAMVAWLKHNDIDVFDCTPAQLEMMCEAGLLQDPVCRSKTVLIGGEAIGASRWRELQSSGMPAFNLYGPTECTVDSTLADLRHAGPVPTIGRPLQNVTVHVLDAALQPVPRQVTGELYIGGAGVARGYLNRPELTAERFIDDPFGAEPGARLYKTGDLGRWQSDGSIEYMGRNDFQVKLRGFRIELGEIEAQLLACEGVAEAAVLALQDEDRGQRLVAYLRPLEGAMPEPVALRAQLAERLPDYMLPSAFVTLAQFPLTPNGKLNRRALPAPDSASLASRPFEAPQGDIEIEVAAIWQDLLNVDRIGRRDDFFTLGGHSLLAVQLVSRLRHARGIEVSLGELFTHPELADFAARLGQAGATQMQAILRADRSGPLPLSWAQQRLWFLDQLDTSAGAAYHMPAGLRLSGQLDAAALRATLDRIVARHESLRTTFAMTDGEPMQRIAAADAGFTLVRRDLSGLSEGERQAELERISAQVYGEPFDLAQGPLIRGQLLRLGEEEHLLLINQHHIISDGWSIGVLVQEVSALYSAFSQGQADPLPPLALQYADYAAWQRQWLQGEVLQAQTDYWKAQLAGAPELLDLPLDRARPAMQSYVGASVNFRLSAQLSQGLKQLGQRHGATLFMTLLAGWGVLMARLSGQREVVIGTPVANRQRREIEALIGFFVNTLALRLSTEGDPTVAEMLAQVKAQTLGAYAHQDIPFEQVVEAISPQRSMSHSALFQTALTYGAAARNDELKLPGLLLSGLHHDSAATKVDLHLMLNEGEQEIGGQLIYAKVLFNASTAERMVDSFEVLLSAMVADEQCRVGRLRLLDERQHDQVLAMGTGPVSAVPPSLVQTLFETQVALRPDALALEFEGRQLSYAELNRRANQVACRLRTMGVRPDARVAICTERGIDMVVGMLGILKAGGAFVPLDPAYPAQRLAYMLADSAPVALLTQKSVEDGLPATSLLSVLVLDDEAAFAGQSSAELDPLEVGLRPDHLAYVIYTSGSTGQPKGVMNRHDSLCNLARAQIELFGVRPGSRVLQFASFSFDASVSEVVMALCSGATLVLASRAALLPGYALTASLQDLAITHVTLPSSAVAAMPEGVRFDALCLVMAGDACPSALAAHWAVHATAFNAYGPTETAVCAAVYRCGPDLLPSVPLGRPISNASIRILDAQGQLVPISVAGEICIGGMGVARGYLNRPELTAERFIDDPFSTEPGARLYKTGDLGRWLADGNVEFLGRTDFQVKLRGFRIELGEIEARLQQCDGVAEAVVLARQDAEGGQRLVAYVRPLEGATPEPLALRAKLAESLPGYMVPAAYVNLAQFPRTPNGKLDRQALPAPESEALASRPYVAPRGDVEVQVAALWQELLKTERVGRLDDFFALGGHSLLAVQLMSRLRLCLGVDVMLSEIFAHPDLAGFSERLGQAGATQMQAILRADRSGPLPLSWAQQRLWFLDQLDTSAGAAYHMPAGLRLSGQLDAAALRATLDRIVARHESLRTTFAMTDGEPMQRIAAADAGFTLVRRDLSGLSEGERQAELERISAQVYGEPFDLAQGPLIRGQLLRLGEEEHLLLINQHHIISDGWSIGVLVQEVSALYSAFSQGQADPLPPLALQYADYAAWQRQWLQGEVLQAQTDYWKAQLAGAPELLDLPLDRARPAMQSYVGASVNFRLSAQLSQGLKQLGQRHGATLFMTLLAGWGVLMARLSGQREVVIGTPVANRQRREIEALIGFFVNTLALRLSTEGDPTVAEMLAQVKAQTLGAYAHQDIPFEQVVEAIRPRRSPSYSPLFQTMLTLNNTPAGGELTLNGVRLSEFEGIGAAAHFDTSLAVTDVNGVLGGNLVYASDLFDRATVERLLHRFERVLGEMVADDQRRVGRLNLLDDAERSQLAQWSQGNVANYSGDRLIHQLFEEQVHKQPDALAVEYEGQRLTYAELNRHSNQVAHRLLALGARPGDRVALCVERGLSMIAGLMGILKAGAGYVPLDPLQPQARLAQMLADCEPVALLTEARVEADLPAQRLLPVLVLDADPSLAHQPQANPQVAGLDGQHLAYVLYTSGSTGQPKGVMVEHRSVLNLWQALERALYARVEPPAKTDKVAVNAALTFDASIKMIVQLLGGRCLAPVPREVRSDGAAMVAWLKHNDIDVFDCTPAQLEMMCEAGLLQDPVCRSKTVLIGGEAIGASRWRELQSSGMPAFNLYGPTECTVDSTLADLRHAGPVPTIGRPLQNVTVHVLDAALQPVPRQVTGELYIGGAGVARGYLNRPELTAERFIDDPFGAEPGARLYKTGDLGRWQSDGSIEYMGRNDFQVKLRGFRIELGEIEAQLLACEGVAEAAVLALQDEDRGQRLVAYLRPLEGAMPEPVALRAQLAERLPDYMLPSAFVTLAQFPLTPNGKLNRRALPAPDSASLASRPYQAPQGDAEIAVAAVWQELLVAGPVGRQDDFFELGGHSLLAVRLVSRLRQTLGVEVALGEVFQHPRLEAFAHRLGLAKQASMGPIPLADRSQKLPLSWAQQRLWFIDQLDSAASASYHMPAGLRLSGRLDRAALQAALDRIVARHEVLRTTFVQEDGEPVQRVAAANCGFALQYHEVGHLQGHEQVFAVERHGLDQAAQAFDLSQGPLICGRLLRLAPDEHVLLIKQHHIISDGWSIGLLIQEVSALYGAFCQARPDPLPPLALQYADYAAWQRAWLQGERLEAQTRFWTSQLRGAPALLDLPADRPRPARQSYRGASHSFVLPADLMEGVRALSQRHGTTIFMTLLAAWSLLLSRLSGQRDVVVGTSVANRPRSELEPLIGFFINTLALRTRLDDATSVAGLLVQVRESTLQAYAHQDMPFEQVVEALQPPRTLAHSPLFQAMFTLNNTPSQALALPGLVLAPVNSAHRTTQFDLSLSMSESGACMLGQIEYATDLFDDTSIVRWSALLLTLLQAMVADDRQVAVQVPLLTTAQREQVLRGFNATYVHRGDDVLVHQLFERSAEQRPEAIALDYEGALLSYAELNRRANQVAHGLLALGVRPDDRVGVCAQRSVEMVVGLLGVLKAGGAYVPLEPAHPAQRLGTMLDDARPVALLVESSALSRQAAAAALVASQTGALPLLPLAEAFVDQPGHNPVLAQLQPNHLAYVIFTSGSTGRPKGAMNEHRGVVNRLLWAQSTFALTPEDRVLQKTPFSFDVSVWEFFLPLLAGARLVIARPGGHQDPQYLARLIDERAISVLHFVPSMLQAYLDEVGAGAGATLRHVKCSGEALTAVLAERAMQAWPHAQLHNLYGPTEAAVDVSWWHCNGQAQAGRVPIGRPIANVQLYLLDEQMQPVPVGVGAQLYIGGVGVGRGYLNRPELTAERFLADPFSDDSRARLYKTGDMARWLADGSIEYLGRNDFQVKLRGLRIELGEIEAALLRCEGVDMAVVSAREDAPGSQQLVAYVVMAQAAFDAAALRESLATTLPEYMLPAAFVRLDALPLSTSGKLDRLSLPPPERSTALAADRAAPEGPIELALASAWKSLLGVERVGRHDHFFALGGHSLLAIRLVSHLRDSLHVELPLQAIFTHPTLAGLAGAVAQAGETVQAPIVRADLGTRRPLSWAQQRLWFLAQLDAAMNPVYNLPLALRLLGRLDAAALRRAFDRIVERHEVLRTRITVVDGQAVQQVDASATADFSAHDLCAMAGSERDAAIERLTRENTTTPFDFGAGVLMRVALLRLAHEEHILLVTQHHIASDGWSIGVLVREVTVLYAAFSQGLPDPLPPLALQYADYAVWQRQLLLGDGLQAQIEHWRARLSGAPTLLDLPLDRPRPLMQSHVGAKVYLRLSPELSRGLKQLAQHHGATLFMTLLAAWAVLMARWSRQHDVVIGTPVANRQRREIEGLIGLFVNTLALRVSTEGDPTVRELLTRVKADTLLDYANQDVPFEQVVEAVQPQRSTRHGPLFQTMLALNDTPEGVAPALPGLKLESVELAHTKAQTDLTLSLVEAGDEIHGSIEYASALFDRATVESMVENFKTLADGMVANPGQRLSALPLLTPVQRRQLLSDFNDTRTTYPHDLCVHELFEVQAAATPAQLAVTHGAQQLNYAELEARANQLAHELRQQGVLPGALVALCMRRSVDLLVALLGILKAGAAYVALDPDHPPARMTFMLEDANADLLITQQLAAMPASVGNARVLCLDAPDVRAQLDRQPTTLLPAGHRLVTPQDLAYVLYTSGSSGKPKGVAVRHQGVVNYLHYTCQAYFPQVAGAVVSSPLAFDATVTSLLAPLVCGKWVKLLDDGLELEQLAAQLKASREPVLFKITPAHLEALGHQLPDQAVADQPHLLVIGGEQLSTRVANLWKTRLLPSAVLVNEYGPTETVVGCSTYFVRRASQIDLARAAIPIGRPIANTQLFVVDAVGGLAPLSVPGELLIGGAGLARGYVNRPELTAERFVANPFQGAGIPGSSQLLYRTGDLVRWLPDGNLEYLGRIDDQVKIRGFRIELGEIEVCLNQHPDVKASVVVAREDLPGDKRLVAYVTASASGTGPEFEASLVAALRAQLQGSLPAFMVPAVIVVLDALPMTPNGKVDKVALPAPQAIDAADRSIEAPRSEAEAAVAAIWQSLLSTGPIGRHDNFFELGGHSLLAVVMASLARKALKVEVPIGLLFAYPTLAAFVATVMERTPPSARSHLVPIRNQGAQRALFLVHAGDGESGYARELARWMDPELPIYGITASGFLTDETAGRNIEAIARAYVSDIREVQPEGPYRLAGWSIGGTIAYEMAQQLIGAGQQVQFLGLIDTRSTYPRKLIDGGRRIDRAHFLLDTLLPSITSEQRNRLGAMAAQGDVVGMLAHCQAMGWLPRELSLDDVERHLDVRHGLSLACEDYAPVPITLPVVYFSARDEQRSEPTMGWAEKLGDRLQLRMVPGTHFSLMEAPQAQILAAGLSSALADAQVCQRSSEEQHYTPRITINIGRAGVAPVFCVPGAGASVTVFTHLSQALGPGLPVHGLQPRGLCGKMMPYLDVPSAARAYAEVIRETLPQGAFHLVGHSYGGWVVTELARQMSEQGRSPASVIVLDSNAPTRPRTPQHFHTRVEILHKLVGLFNLHLARPLALNAADFEPLEPEPQLALLLTRLVEAKLMPPRTSLQVLQGIVQVFGRNLNADYKPDVPFAGHLHVAIAAERDSIRDEEPQRSEALLVGWRAHAPQVRIWQAPGNHLTLLSPPHVNALATWMKEVLSAAELHA